MKEQGFTQAGITQTKAKHGGEVVVKVCGGYSIMTATNYQVWKKQK